MNTISSSINWTQNVLECVNYFFWTHFTLEQTVFVAGLDIDAFEENIEMDEQTIEKTAPSSNIIVRPKRNIQLTRTIKTWLDILPKVPSHYHRSSSNKKYVESTFRSQLHMYRVFKEWCIKNHYKTASRKTFSKVLTKVYRYSSFL